MLTRIDDDDDIDIGVIGGGRGRFEK